MQLLCAVCGCLVWLVGNVLLINDFNQSQITELDINYFGKAVFVRNACTYIKYSASIYFNNRMMVFTTLLCYVDYK